MQKGKIILFIILAIGQLLLAQTTNDQKYRVVIRRAASTMKVDGNLNEAAWNASDIAKNFINAQPTDGVPSTNQTEVRVLFDDKFLYIGAKCWQKRGTYVVQSLKRDYPGGTTDIIGINIDPFRDKQNAFNFTISPYGVQREGLVANGQDLSTDWDNRWFSEVQNYDDYWTCEVAIPFKTLRYRVNEGKNEWLINFTRFDQSLAATERSSWSPIPRQFNGNNINFSGTMEWETPPPSSGKNIALIPYTLGNLDKDFLKKTKNQRLDFGGDAKIALSSSMNLDLTGNPDFAQVEVDKQQTNLSRFELLFPERRQFFIENADLFSTFGFESQNPFFSRRIGLKDNVRVPIIAGARLTGRLNRNWRIGVMDIQTNAQQDIKLAASNFLATAIQRKVFQRSNVSFILVNKQNSVFDSTSANVFNWDSNSYNRVAGLDFNYFSNDNRWRNKLFVHHSFSPTNNAKAISAAGRVAYHTRNWLVENNTIAIGKDFNAETGYVPRRDIFRTESFYSRTFWTETPLLQSWSIAQDHDFYWRLSDKKLTDFDFSPVIVRFNFQSGANLSVTPIRWDYTYLFQSFDPTNTGGKKLKENTDYLYKSFRINYHSNLRKRFNVTGNARFGEYFNGSLQNVQLNVAYRFQPFGIASLDVNYNKINLPEGYNDRVLWLIGPRIDFSFRKDLFFTTFLQYNNQINNVNLNMRFQWRFAPVSDLFIVYTDNYFAEADNLNGYNYRAFETKNRAVVLKCTYWLGL